MKRPLLFAVCLAALTLPSFGQVLLQISSVTFSTYTVGAPITFAIQVADTTGTFKLDSYELTLTPEILTSTSGPPTFAPTTTFGTPTFSIPSAISSIYTFAGQSGDTSGGFSGNSNNDLTISNSFVTILTATFTPTAAGSYYITFAPYGTSTDALYAPGSSTPLSGVTENGTTIAVVPEPSAVSLMLASGLLLLALGSCRFFPSRAPVSLSS